MIFVVLVGLDLRSGSDLKPGIDNNLTCIHPKRGFQTLVPKHGSLGSPHSDPLPMLRPPIYNHMGPDHSGPEHSGPEQGVPNTWTCPSLLLLQLKTLG